MEDLKKVIAKNISSLRKNMNMTQAELAEKLSYSDKAISKWERGEAIPDVLVLKAIADMSGVTVDYLLTVHDNEECAVQETDESVKSKRHLFISLVSVGFLWLAVTAVYVILRLTVFPVWSWFFFLFAVPVTFLLFLIFNCLWGKPVFTYVFVSGLIWTLLLSICFILFEKSVWLILVIGVPAQTIVLFWAGIFQKNKRHK